MDNHTLNRFMLSLFPSATLLAPVLAEPPPHVLIILADDLGYSDIGAYGGEIRTPHIDTLAENGLRFRSFYNTARCSPTRAALLTGSYSQLVSDNPVEPLPVLRPDNNITMAELLRDAGYRTAMAGKWHLGFGAGQAPADRGFQHGLATRGSGYWDQDSVDYWSENNVIPTPVYGNQPGDFYRTDASVDYGLAFLDHHFSQQDDAPFFLYLAFNAPHFPLTAPPETFLEAPSGETPYDEIYQAGWDVMRTNRYQRMRDLGVIGPDAPLPDYSDTPFNSGEFWPVSPWDTLGANRRADLARRMAIYAGMIERMDDAIGRILDDLQARGELDRTLIWIFSDNGGTAEGGLYGRSFGQNNHAPLTSAAFNAMGHPDSNDDLYLGGGWANVANAPFRLYKRYSHEGGIRSPLIIHGPTNIVRATGWTDQVGHVMDVLPTLADLLDISQHAPPLPDPYVLPAVSSAYVESTRPTENVLLSIGVTGDNVRGLIRVDPQSTEEVSRRAVGQTFRVPDSADMYGVTHVSISLGRPLNFNHDPHGFQLAFMEDTTGSRIGDTLVGEIHLFDLSGLTSAQHDNLTFELSHPVHLEAGKTYTVEFWYAHDDPTHTQANIVEPGYSAANLQVRRGTGIYHAGIYVEAESPGLGTDFPFGDQLAPVQSNMSMDLVIQAVPLTPLSYAPWTGVSLLPVFQNGSPFPREIGFEHAGTRAWIDGDWKLVTKNFNALDGASLQDTLELYHMPTDPVEWVNRALEQPALTRTMVDAWDTWADTVGLPASHLLNRNIAMARPAQDAIIDYLLDTFNRNDHVVIDAEATGLSGALLPTPAVQHTYHPGFTSSGTAHGIQVRDGALQLAADGHTSEVGLTINFTDASILDAGGFVVEMDVLEVTGTGSDLNHQYAGFGVGLSSTEAATGGVMGSPDSLRHSRADFFVELTAEGIVQVWRKGNLLNSTPVDTTSGRLTAVFNVPSFAAGDSVQVRVFLNGELVDIRSDHPDWVHRQFDWDHGGQNYIALGGRGAKVTVDNFAVRARSMERILAAGAARDAGWDGDEAHPDYSPALPDRSNLYHWLIGTDLADPDDQVRGLTVQPGTMDGPTPLLHLRTRRNVEGLFDLAPVTSVTTNLLDGPTAWTVIAWEEHSRSPAVDAPSHDLIEAGLPEPWRDEKKLFILLRYQ